MTTAPWLKFYPSDWRSDPRLRVCGMAARGLWIEMLALMHEAEPYGHLVVNGVVPTDTQLAILVGAPPDQVPALLAELETAGVFSRNRALVIYSRRMTRDEKRRKDGEKAQKTQAKLPGSRRAKAVENKEENLPAIEVVDGVEVQPPSTQIPEARIQKEKKEPIGSQKKRRGETPIPDDWEPDDHLFAYAAKHGLDRTRTLREAELFRNRAMAKDERYVDWSRAFMTWVQRAADYRPPIGKIETTMPIGTTTDDEEWKLRIRGWTKGIWKPDYGPEPGKPGCRVPSQLLDEMAA